MSTVRALLLWPVAPGRAARALAGRWVVCVAPLLPAMAVGLLLSARGVGRADAAACAAAVGGALLGMTIGGALASLPASRIAGSRPGLRDLLPPCAVAATWAVLLLALLAGLLRALGVGAPAVLWAALLVLAHGAASGFGLVRADEAPEPGRGGVAACLGLAGAVAGLWLALSLAQAHLVLPVRAPVAFGGARPGNLLLVRRTGEAPEGAFVLLRERGGPEALFARMSSGGNAVPVGVGPDSVDVSSGWDIAGRVFYRLGGRDWGRAVSTFAVPE